MASQAVAVLLAVFLFLAVNGRVTRGLEGLLIGEGLASFKAGFLLPIRLDWSIWLGALLLLVVLAYQILMLRISWLHMLFMSLLSLLCGMLFLVLITIAGSALMTSGDWTGVGVYVAIILLSLYVLSDFMVRLAIPGNPDLEGIDRGYVAAILWMDAATLAAFLQMFAIAAA